MKHFVYLLLVAGLLSTSCNRVKKGAKETINKSGELVGKTATEFAEGVTEGVDRALDCEIVVSEALRDQGIGTGAFSIENGPENGTDNVLVVYMAFEEDIEQTLEATVFTKKGLESGRTTSVVKAAKGESGYINFSFDKQMSIETKSRIEIK